MEIENCKITLAICYETFVPEHAKYAYGKGSNVYIASVLNSMNSIDNDIERLSEISRKYEMTVCMSNFTRISGGYKCAGKSSVWDCEGNLKAQLDSGT